MFYVRLFGKNNGRVKIDDINSTSKVIELKQKVADRLGHELNGLVLTYCGHVLDDNSTVDQCNIQAGATIYALQRKCDQAKTKETIEKGEVQELVTALQTAFLSPSSRNMVHQMLANPKVMANIVASTPGLASNPIALGILHDPVLVELLADPTNIQRTIDMHPELYLAIVALASAINEETATAASAGAGPSGSRTDAYSLDRMSDDDDDVAAASAQASQPITSSQLASALASATASGATSQPGGVITTDLFHQAMQQALGLAPGEANADSEMGQVPHGPPTSGQPQSEHEREVQLQTLRDMGITDDAISRRALEVTNGDVQAALELIFGDGI